MTTAAASPQTYAEPFGGMAYFRKFTVDEYHTLIRTGVLGPDDPVELLEGYLVLKMPRGPEHDFAIMALQKRLYRMVPAGWEVRGQLAATLTDSEPEPDIAVVRGDESVYEHRHPSPQDVSLLVEVSDSSLTRDTRDKGRIYAQAGIPVYWVVNIPDRKVEVFSAPSGPAYATRTEYPPGSAVPVVLDGTRVGTIPVSDLLP